MSYKEDKERARQTCIEIQNLLSQSATSWGELAELQDYMEKLGKRYGLLKELKENGLL